MLAKYDIMLVIAAAVSIIGAVAIYAAPAAQAATDGPLVIAKQGYFFVGGRIDRDDRGRARWSGRLTSNTKSRKKRTHPYPIVMIHGGGQTGSNFTGTPDGREGWAQYFLERGYAVYVVDQPGRGRSALRADVRRNECTAAISCDRAAIHRAGTLQSVAAGESCIRNGRGRAMAGDPVFDQFYAEQLPSIAELRQAAGTQSRCGRGAARQNRTGHFAHPFAVGRLRLADRRCAAQSGEGNRGGRAVRPAGADAEFKGAPDYFGDGPLRSPGALPRCRSLMVASRMRPSSPLCSRIKPTVPI